ncbi:hypothetical protein [Lysobacter sp. 1R34A]|uniref:hypothetical protein n=1 Tax=Lysobacter sp. 1R34A TaxID=3445786 RepID=UPI003EEC251B
MAGRFCAVIFPAMISSIVEKEVARLDGFLYGIAALNGGIRSYSAYAYAVEPKEGASIEQSLQDCYTWNPGMEFSEVRRLDKGLRDLEGEIQSFLIRDLPGHSADAVSTLQAYLAFRVMDMIMVIREDRPVLDVFRLTLAPERATSECVFFCLKMEAGLVFLQFNNDIPFIDSLDA